ncbi:hypothetical protein Tco_0162241 [Tanacetum coccineum]
MQASQDRQKSYADRKRKPNVSLKWRQSYLKVSPWKGVATAGNSLRELEQRSPHIPSPVCGREPVENHGTGRSNELKRTEYHWLRFAGTLGGALSSPGNVKIRSNKNTHNSSQTGLRHLLQGLKL